MCTNGGRYSGCLQRHAETAVQCSLISNLRSRRESDCALNTATESDGEDMEDLDADSESGGRDRELGFRGSDQQEVQVGGACEPSFYSQPLTPRPIIDSISCSAARPGLVSICNCIRISLLQSCEERHATNEKAVSEEQRTRA